MDKLKPHEIRKIMFHPENNPDVISLVKRKDGNWRGFTMKGEELVQVRAGDPQTALQELITASK